MLLDDTAAMAAARNCAAGELPAFEPGGPREYIYFDPAGTRVGIVTCGGLCPGLNNVIRGLVLELADDYGVTRHCRLPQRLPGADRRRRAGAR